MSLNLGIHNSYVCTNLMQGYTTTATANGTTTLTSASTHNQFFTGTLNQSIDLPAPSTLTNGYGYTLVNTSSGTLTVQHTGSTTVTGGQSLTVAPFTLNVSSTASWGAATSGTISVPTTVSSPQLVTFTGKTATSFTGCVASGSFTTNAGTVSGTAGTVILIASGLQSDLTCVDTTGVSGNFGGWFASATVSAGGVTSLTAGTGISLSASTGAITVSIANTSVTAGAYGSSSAVPMFMVNAQGQLTSAGTTQLSLTTGVTGSLPVSNGGTGVSTAPSNGQILIGNGTGFTLSTLSVSGTGISVTNGAGTITLSNTGVTGLSAGTGIAISATTGTITISSTGTSGVTTFSAGTTGFSPTSPATGAVVLSGTLNVANGGTGVTSASNGQLLIGNGSGFALSTLTAGSGISVVNGSGSITISIPTSGVTNAMLANSSLTVSAGTGLSGGGAVSLGGSTTLSIANTAVTAGTYGSSSAVPTFMVNAQGQLTSAGTTQLSLTTGVTGSLPVSNGGTGVSTAPGNGQILIGNGTGFSLSTLTAGSGISITNASGSITLSNTGVTTFSAGTTGFSPTSATTGAVVLAGTLNASNGGTGNTAAFTAGGVAFGSSTTVLGTSAAGTTGQLLVSAGAGTPTWTSSPSVTSLTISGLTANSFVYSGTAGLLTTTAAPTNGQILVGVTGSAPASVSMSGDVTLSQTGVANVIAVDLLPINATTGANSSIYFGYSGSVPTAPTSIGIGYQALNVASSGTSKNIAIGNNALSSLVNGQMLEGSNIAIGFNAMSNTEGSINNIAIGTAALNSYLPGTANNIIITNNNTGIFSNVFGCVGIGFQTLEGSTYSTGTASQTGTTITGVGTTFTPTMIGYYIRFSTGQVAIISSFVSATSLTSTSSQTVASTTFTIYSSASSCVSLGNWALQVCSSNESVGVGNRAGFNMTKSSYSVGTAGTGGVSSTTLTGVGTNWSIVMEGSLIIFAGGTQQSVSVVSSPTSITMGSAVTIPNGTAYTIYLLRSANTFLGASSGETLTTGHGNTIIGYNSNCGADAINAIVIGTDAKAGVQSATDTIIIGQSAGNLTATGDGNIGIGARTFQVATSANQCVSIGYQAGQGITSGSANTILGYNAGASITTLTNNVVIGSGADSTVGGAVSIGQGITANQTGGLFVQHRGPLSVTVNMAGFIAGTNELVELTSSRRFKQNIRDLEDVTDKFAQLRPVRFNAIEGHGDPNDEHIGLIAEEVEEIFPEFVTHDTEGQTTGMMYDRMISLLIKEMHRLGRENSTLKARLDRLEQV